MTLVAAGYLAVSLAGGGGAEAGCNTVRGQATVEDGHLVTGPLMSTRRACEPELREQERLGHRAAGQPSAARAVGPYLALHWGEGERWWVGPERESETFRAGYERPERMPSSQERATEKSVSLVRGATLARCRSARG